MWPLAGLLLFVIGAAAAKRRKVSAESGPLEEEPDAGKTAAEAVKVAQEAIEAAKAGAAQGTPEGAAQAADALDQAAEATTAAAGSEVSPLLEALTKQVEALAAAAAAAAGVPPPPKTSPGQPPLPKEKTETVVVVEPAPPAGAPLPPPPKPTASFPTAIPTSIPEAIAAAEQIAQSLPIPVAVQKPGDAPPPLATEETKPQADPSGTVQLARTLLDAETRSGWRIADQTAVKVWQGKVGLVNDGKFGVKSALKMADEVGVLPLVRYWPSGSASKSAALQSYRNDLHTKAATLEAQGRVPHARAVEISANREDARAFGNANPKPVSGAERLAELSELTRSVA